MNKTRLIALGIAALAALTFVATALRTHPAVVTTGVALRHSSPSTVRFLPLGDSYTIGQSVRRADRWPNQLAARYETAGMPFRILANPAVTGYTTQDLIDRELPLVARYRPGFITILIGVNDEVHGIHPAAFEHNLRLIIRRAKAEMTAPKEILLITIPDFAKTPTGAGFGDPTALTKNVERFNSIIERVAHQSGLPLADVLPASELVTQNPSLVADDGLHPSGKQYSLWTDAIRRTLRTAGFFARR